MKNNSIPFTYSYSSLIISSIFFSKISFSEYGLFSMTMMSISETNGIAIPFATLPI